MRIASCCSWCWAVIAVVLICPAVGFGQEGPSLEERLSRFTRAESLTLEGRAYFTYWYDLQDEQKRDEGEKEPHNNSFELTRFYFGVRARLAPWLSLRLTSDVGPERKRVKTSSGGDPGHTHEVDGEQSLQFFIKYAYMDATLAQGLVLRAGVVDHPYSNYLDDFWGYRFVFKNVGDEEKVYDSADAGFQLRYTLPQNMGLLAVGAFNGAGYKNSRDSDGAKDAWLFFHLTPLRGMGELAGRFGLAGWVSHGVNLGSDAPTHLVYSGSLTYQCPTVTLAYQFLGNGLESGGSDDRIWGMGHGAYLKVSLPENLGILGRFAYWDADSKNDDNRRKYQALTGLSWTPMSLFQMAASGLVTWYDDAKGDPETEPHIRFLLSTELRF